jgi:hypothetical protein
MKKIIEHIVAKLRGASIFSRSEAIKGNKSGGVRDSNKVDWRDAKTNSIS